MGERSVSGACVVRTPGSVYAHIRATRQRGIEDLSRPTYASSPPAAPYRWPRWSTVPSERKWEPVAPSVTRVPASSPPVGPAREAQSPAPASKHVSDVVHIENSGSAACVDRARAVSRYLEGSEKHAPQGALPTSATASGRALGVQRYRRRIHHSCHRFRSLPGSGAGVDGMVSHPSTDSPAVALSVVEWHVPAARDHVSMTVRSMNSQLPRERIEGRQRVNRERHSSPGGRSFTRTVPAVVGDQLGNVTSTL